MISASSTQGYPLWQCTLPIRVMKLLGVKLLVVSNAVGGLNPTYNVGDIMLVRDHINMFGLSGESPLRGPNDESFGPRFFSVNNLYDAKWREVAVEAAERVGGRTVLHFLSSEPSLRSGYPPPSTRESSPCPAVPTTRAWRS